VKGGFFHSERFHKKTMEVSNYDESTEWYS
jgi:hypothetical protein